MFSVLLGIIGWQELLVVAVIILILFGGRKIPELMRSLGRGIREFKEGMNEITNLDDTTTHSQTKNETHQVKEENKN